MQGVIGLLALLAAGTAAAQTEPKAPPSQAPPPAVVAWVRANAVPVGAPQSEPGPAEAAAIDQAVAGARVIGLGENGHGRHEPLAYRNRLIRHLVAHDGLTAVALESGFAESRRLYDYVLGGPGEAQPLVRDGLTHAFGRLRENLELVEWLRGWNAAHPARPVHLYGVDLSTIQSAPPGAKGYGVILDRIDAYLLRAAPSGSAGVRARLRPFAHRFTETDYPSYTAQDRAAATAATAEAAAYLADHSSEMVRATSAFDHAWAAEEVEDARRLLDAFATWTDDPTQLDRLMALIAVRDRAMADHLGWALAREGPRGKVLIFQANGHVAAAPLVGSVMRLFPSQPAVTGMLLRARLGPAYKAVATVSSWGRSADDATLGSIDRAFAAAGAAPAWLDLDAPGRPAWWAQPRSASQGEHRVDDLTPSRTFDALLYLPTLTPVTPLEESPGRK